jgi:addiction module HigA family antidote
MQKPLQWITFLEIGESRSLPSLSARAFAFFINISFALVDYTRTREMRTGLPTIHPGEFLEKALHDLRVSQAQFARAIGVSPMRISHVVKGSRPVTAELALLFGRAFAQSPEYWLNLQAAYDLKTAERRIGARLEGISKVASAAKDVRHMKGMLNPRHAVSVEEMKRSVRRSRGRRTP